MPSAAESAVDDSLGRLWIEQLEQLLGKYRDVDGGHVKQDGQRAQLSPRRCPAAPVGVRPS